MVRSFISGRRRGWDTAVTTALVVIAGALTVLLVLASVVAGLVGDSCGSGLCDYGLMETAGWVGLLGIPASFLLSLGFTLWRWMKGRSTWWAGIVAVAAVLATFLLGMVLLYAGVGRTLFS